MTHEDFSFKKFSVSHDNSTMKVGTDAVLLGATVARYVPDDLNSINSILDIGTGCGVLALIMAQYFNNANIFAIDIDNRSIIEANNNFSKSLWADRCLAKCVSLQEYSYKSKQLFDLIISNPPFFENSLKSPYKVKNIARHTDNLPLPILVNCVNKLLSPVGIFCCIFPVQVGCDFKLLALKENLFCINEIQIFDKPTNINPVRIILYFSKKYAIKQNYKYYIHNTDSSLSEWYRDIAGDLVNCD